MARIACPSCAKNLNVPDQYAGKKVKCPACQAVMTVPAAAPPRPPAEEPVEVTPVAPSGRRAAPPPVPDRDEDSDDRPRRRPRYDDDEDDRPRRRRPIRRGSEFAPCPYCGAADATRVYWTFWGGWIGPLIINQVRCNECGTNYNGTHGDYYNPRSDLRPRVRLPGLDRRRGRHHRRGARQLLAGDPTLQTPVKRGKKPRNR
jgi:hypothetical protein